MRLLEPGGDPAMRWSWRRLPLRSQWLGVGVLLASVCVLGGLLAFWRHEEARGEREMSAQALLLARMMAGEVSSALEAGDAPAAQRRLERLAVLPRAAFGVLLRGDGALLADWNPRRVPGAPWREHPGEVFSLPTVVVARLPVPVPGGPPGTLLVGLARADWERERERTRWRALLGGLVLWGLGVGGVLGAGRVLMRPLERATRTVRRMAEGDFGAREALETSAPDEAGLLSAAVSRLMEGAYAQVEVLDALVVEARGYQERVHEQHRRLESQEHELLQAQDQLVVADRRSSVGTLAAGVAHEVNNPLAYITANIQFVLQELSEFSRRDALAAEPLGVEADWAEFHSALSEARDGCTRVQHIVQSLKSFSCGDDGRHELLALVPVLRTALNMAGNEIRHRARLEQDFPEDLCVDANEVRLAQVFLNLLLNAAQAIEPGDMERQAIRVRLRRGGDGWVRVSITDTGCGMSPEVRARLFTPFFTTKPVGVGTGLGLSVCQGLVRGMGGRIEVQSEPGRGSTFTVCLPDAGARRPLGGSPRASRAESPRVRVLVVDDEPLVGLSLRRALGREHEVCVASSAREALARVCQGAPFDAILCDLMMPGMSGMELFAELQRTSPEQAERVLFLSGGVFTPEAGAFLERHEARRLLKPLDLDTLRERLHALVRATARAAPDAPELRPPSADSRRSDSGPAAPRPSA